MTAEEKKNWYKRVVPMAMKQRRLVKNAFTDELDKEFLLDLQLDENWTFPSAAIAEEWLLRTRWAANKRHIELSDFRPDATMVKLHSELLKEVWKMYYEQDGKFLQQKYQGFCLAKEKEYIAMYSTEEFRKVEEMRDQYFLEKLKLEISLKDANARANKLAEENYKLKEKCDKLMNDASNSQDYINLEKRNAELEKMLEIERNLLTKANQKLNEFQTVEV